MTAMHSLIVGSPGVGKSTLIRRILAELNRPVFGFVTRKEKDEWDPDLGNPIYIYPAEETPVRTEENLVGHCKDRRPVVYKEAFDRFAPRLQEPVPRGAVILMDEIGFMEASSEAFCAAIMKLLEGDIPILAAVKDKDTPFLRAVRSHPKARLFHISPENRDSLLSSILVHMEEAARKADRDTPQQSCGNKSPKRLVPQTLI